MNYLGGLYYLTIDESKISKSSLSILECKYSKNSKLPSKGDIRDGLLKMVLFSNLENVRIKDKLYNVTPVLNLSSPKITNSITNKSFISNIANFINLNNFNVNEKTQINTLFEEANVNNFIIQTSGAV